MAVNEFIDLPRLPKVNPDGSINVTGTIVTDPAVNIHDSNGNPLLSLAGSLNVNITNTSLSVTQGTSPWVVDGTVQASQSGIWSVGRTWSLSLASDHVNTAQEGLWDVSVNNFPAVQPISGTVTALQGTSPWLTSRNWTLSDSTDSIAAFQGTSPWVVSGTVTTSPNVNIHDSAGNNLNSTANALHTLITNTSLSVTQGTSPWNISGTVTSNQGTPALPGNAWYVAITDGAVTVGVDPATFSLNVNIVGPQNFGSPTTAVRTASLIGNTAGLASFGSGTTSSQTLRVVLPTDQTAIPVSQSGTWTTGRTWALSLASDHVNAAQEGAWTVTANQGTSPWVVSGTVIANEDKNYGTVGANTLRTASQIGNATGAALFGAGTTTAQVLRVVLPTDQTAIPATQSGTWNINNISGTISLPTGAATEASLVKLTLAQGSTTSGQSGSLTFGAVTAAAPTYTNATSNSLSLTTAGALRVDGSATTQPVSGTVTANQGGAPWSIIPGSPTITTYAAVSNFTLAATPTDVFTITGSGTKTIQVRRIVLSGTNSGNTNARVDIIKRSTANSAGTSTTLTNVPYDSNNAAATATVRSYTANPTLGTTVGAVAGRYLFFALLGSSNPSQVQEVDFGDLSDQAIYLRGTSEVLAVNFAGATISGTTIISIKVEWTEQ